MLELPTKTMTPFFGGLTRSPASKASDLTPATLELSGCDAVLVRADADMDLAARAIAFGLRLNGGNTCIAPRRIYAVGPTAAAALQAVVPADLRVREVADDDSAVLHANQSRFGLGATIFSRDLVAARAMAARLDTGLVIINDMIAPSADPRVPFGGRKRSGFGVTRGAEGLLDMTVPKVLLLSPGRWRPHFDPSTPADQSLFADYMTAAHGRGLRKRLRAAAALIRALAAKSKVPHSHVNTPEPVISSPL